MEMYLTIQASFGFVIYPLLMPENKLANIPPSLSCIECDPPILYWMWPPHLILNVTPPSYIECDPPSYIECDPPILYWMWPPHLILNVTPHLILNVTPPSYIECDPPILYWMWPPHLILNVTPPPPSYTQPTHRPSSDNSCHKSKLIQNQRCLSLNPSWILH